MSQGTPAAALAFRNRSAKHAFGNPVTSEGVHPGHEIWPHVPQYLDHHLQNVSQNATYNQYGWSESFEDGTLRPSAGADRATFGYMFNGHSDTHDKLPAPEYNSWYTHNDRPLSQDIGDVHQYQPVSFTPPLGGWYATAPAYMDGPMNSTYPPNEMIYQTSNDFAPIPVTNSGDVHPTPLQPTETPPLSKSPFSTLSSGWSDDALHNHFTDVDIGTIAAGVDPLMPSVGSEFDFPGVGSFSIYEHPPALKVEIDTNQRRPSPAKTQRSVSQVSEPFSNGSEPRAAKGSARKRQSSPGTEIVLANTGKTSFNDCVTVFETVPGTISQTKRRRKLSPSSHESFKVTRKIGACLECRFRKRPCAPGTPCPYCIKIFGPSDIAEVNCHRESPFVGYTVTDYFLVTSNKRIIDFTLKLPKSEPDNALMAPQQWVMIDGRSGPCSLPTRVPIRQQFLADLSLEDQAEIWRTKKRPPASDGNDFHLPEYVTVPAEDDEALGRRLEEWAVKYAAKFSRFHSGRYPTAYAYNVGVTYVSKQLPEHELIATLLKGTALAYVLRAGVKCTPDSSFQIVQAKIDTLLYQRLRAAEVSQFAMLQKLVWVSAGRLKQHQLYPVSYVIWQTMRSICLRASHLANLQGRFKAPGNFAFTKEVDHLGHCFNLLLATHTALFRSNSPILLDFTQANNQALLGGDQELIDEAMKLRKVILNFQEYSLSRPFRSSNWYRDNMYRRFRSILHGKGFQLEGSEKNKSKVPPRKVRGGGEPGESGESGKPGKSGKSGKSGKRNSGKQDVLMDTV